MFFNFHQWANVELCVNNTMILNHYTLTCSSFFSSCSLYRLVVRSKSKLLLEERILELCWHILCQEFFLFVRHLTYLLLLLVKAFFSQLTDRYYVYALVTGQENKCLFLWRTLYFLGTRELEALFWKYRIFPKKPFLSSLAKVLNNLNWQIKHELPCGSWGCQGTELGQFSVFLNKSGFEPYLDCLRFFIATYQEFTCCWRGSS